MVYNLRSSLTVLMRGLPVDFPGATSLVLRKRRRILDTVFLVVRRRSAIVRIGVPDLAIPTICHRHLILRGAGMTTLNFTQAQLAIADSEITFNENTGFVFLAIF